MIELHRIAAAVSGVLAGDGTIAVGGVAHPLNAGAGDLALAIEAEAAALLARSQARAALVARNAVVPANISASIAVAQPRVALAALTALFRRADAPPPGVHATAVIEPEVALGTGVAVGALAWIGARAVLGERSVIMPQASIGQDARIGVGCTIHSGARIGAGVILGDRVIVHQNAVVGSDGFSFASPQFDGAPAIAKIHSLGTVIVADDVEIGACATIDRATIAATRIGARTKIDNLVQVAHNATIGEDCLIAGHVGISGSVTIENLAVLAGQSGIADHRRIGKGAMVMAASGVGRDVAPGEVVGGLPAIPRERLVQQWVHLTRLKTLFATVTDLKNRIMRLENAKNQREDGGDHTR
jgi:UDP-3-O-[3-hydroxymyristoyl] glucosamine N-acyltransferase